MSQAAMDGLKATKGKLYDSITAIRDGPLSLSVLCYGAGISLVATGFLSAFGNLFSLSPISALVHAYLFLGGCLIVCLEARGYNPKWITEWIQFYCRFIPKSVIVFALTSCTPNPAHLFFLIYRFLTLVWGRGVFFFLLGTLAIAQWSLLDLLVGGYCCVLGVGMVWYGKSAMKKLEGLKGQIKDERSLRIKFEEFDKDNTGTLDVHELATLCQQLGSELTTAELEATMLCLDQNDDKGIAYEEFLRWWTSDKLLV
ncbi:unnamed protein product [Chrysoparadoxa australica]